MTIARLQEEQGNYKRAIEGYQGALDKDNENLEACHRLGILYDRVGNTDASDQYFLRALELAPKDADLLGATRS